MDPLYKQGLRDAKEMLEEGIFSFEEFEEEKKRLKAERDERARKTNESRGESATSGGGDARKDGADGCLNALPGKNIAGGGGDVLPKTLQFAGAFASRRVKKNAHWMTAGMGEGEDAGLPPTGESRTAVMEDKGREDASGPVTKRTEKAFSDTESEEVEEEKVEPKGAGEGKSKGKLKVIDLREKSAGFDNNTISDDEEEDEDEDEDDPCVLCGSNDNPEQQLLCDRCNKSYHLKCVNLTEIPEGDWFCDVCKEKNKLRVRRTRSTALSNTSGASNDFEPDKQEKQGKRSADSDPSRQMLDDSSDDDSDLGDKSSDVEMTYTRFGKKRRVRKKDKIVSLIQHSSMPAHVSNRARSATPSEEGEESEEEKGSKRKRGRPRRSSSSLAEKKKGRGGYALSSSSGEEESSERRKTRGEGRVKKVNGSRGGGSSSEGDEGMEGKAGRRRRVRDTKSSGEYDADEGDEDEEGEEREDVGVVGRRKKRIGKLKKLEEDVLEMANEGKRAEEHRSEMKTAALIEKGEELVLVSKGASEGNDSQVRVPTSMAKHLQAHQRAGIKFAWECLVDQEEGCILAHCMGLGKSLQVVCLLYALLQKRDGSKDAKDKDEAVMIVAPVNTLANWVKEFDKWLPAEDETVPQTFIMSEAGNLTADRVQMVEEWSSNGGILVIGYEQYRNLASGARLRSKKWKQALQQCLVDPGPSLVVCDEGHVLRNSKSGIAQALAKIKTKRRLILSGTPLQNNLREYHCMVNFVRPGLLGTDKTFRRDFIDPILNGQCVDSTESDVRRMRHRSHVLHNLMKVCVDRADYRVLSTYLPPKYEYVIGVRLSKLQCDLYRKYLDMTFQGRSMDAYSRLGANGVKGKVFDAYHSLAKVWTHPGILAYERETRGGYDSMDDFIADSTDNDDDDDDSSDSDSGGKRKKAKKDDDKWRPEGSGGEERSVKDEDWWVELLGDVAAVDEGGSGKLMFMLEVLKEASEVQDKVLVFSQSLLLLDVIERVLVSAAKQGKQKWKIGKDYFRIDGSTQSETRQDWVDDFNKPNNMRARVFLISTRAGGLGINLVAANRVILMDASWNPSHDKQALFRSYRFGQTKPVYVYRLLAHGTMEEKIYGRQVTKQALAARVVDSEETGRHFTFEELSTLFEFNPDQDADSYDAKPEPGANNAPVAHPASSGTAPLSSDPTEAVGAAQGAGPQENGLSDNRKLWATGAARPPADVMLTRVLARLLPKWIVGYHEADSLVEVEPCLTPEEMEAAWADWRSREEMLSQQNPNPPDRSVGGVGSVGKAAAPTPQYPTQLVLSQEGQLEKDQLEAKIAQIWDQTHKLLASGVPNDSPQVKSLQQESWQCVQRIKVIKETQQQLEIQVNVPEDRFLVNGMIRFTTGGVTYHAPRPSYLPVGSLLFVRVPLLPKAPGK